MKVGMRAMLASPAMRRSATILVLTAALLAAAAPAGAATLSLDHGCYLARQPALPNGQTIAVQGAGFAPGASVDFALGSTQLGALTADANGAVAGRFQAPSLAASQFRSTRTLTASDGTNQGTAAVELRRLAADFLPSAGNPLRLRVRFFVYGFGPVLTALNVPTRQPVYEHVLDPSGRRRATFLVGHAGGPCGDLRTTPRRILPFRTTRNGRWRFVFTTKLRYSARSTPAVSVGFIVRTVFRP
jgi:hypothetical protein